MKNLKIFERFAKGKLVASTKNNTCVIYTRVSTKEQAENNMSLDTQRRACENYAKKNNFRIMAYFGGTYESAKTDERAEFNSMLSYVQKSRDKISHIIVYSVDRFSRSGANAIYIADQLKHEGVSIQSISQPTDANTSSGTLQQNIQFIFSEYDNQLRREKSVAGMRDKLLRGEWCVKPPVGYDIITINGSRSIKVNKDGELVRKIFLWKYYERASQVEIRHRLLAMGLRVGHGYISSILRNPFYCGILSNKLLQGKTVQGKHEKLVSQEIFLAINEILLQERARHSWYKDNPELPLRRVLICLKCKKNMTGYCVKKKNLYYYKCSTIGCLCNKNVISIHRYFKEILRKIKIDEQNYPNLKKEFATNFIKVEKIGRTNTTTYKGFLTAINNKIEILEEKYILNNLSEQLYKKHLTRLQNEKHNIEIQLDKAKAGLVPKDIIKQERENISNNILGLWEIGDLKTKRLIQAIIFPKGIYYCRITDNLIIKNIAEGFKLMPRQLT